MTTRKHHHSHHEPHEQSAEAEASPSERAEAPAPDEAAAPDERYLRLAADFENFRRRKEQELRDARRYAAEDAVKSMLPVLDNLRRAVEHAPDGGEIASGLNLMVREFEAALERVGVERIAAVGEPFDPAVHEAIGGEDSADVETETVIAEILPGYRLHDRVLRPALVRIAHPAPAGA